MRFWWFLFMDTHTCILCAHSKNMSQDVFIALLLLCSVAGTKKNSCVNQRHIFFGFASSLEFNINFRWSDIKLTLSTTTKNISATKKRTLPKKNGEKIAWYHMCISIYRIKCSIYHLNWVLNMINNISMLSTRVINRRFYDSIATNGYNRIWMWVLCAYIYLLVHLVYLFWSV